MSRKIKLEDRIVFMRIRIKRLYEINTLKTRERAHGLEEGVRIVEGYNDEEVRYERNRKKGGEGR